MANPDRTVHPFLRGLESPRILAHRGLVTDEMRADGILENSVAAIAAAEAVGADIIESDCHRTSDGQIVLFHDDRLERILGDPRRISDVTTHELEEMMATRGGLARLADALAGFPGVRFNIDVKADAAAHEAGRIAGQFAERVLLTSFSDRRRQAAMRAARAIGGAPATSAGTSTVAQAYAASRLRWRRATARALRGIDALQVPERHGRVRIVTPAFVDAAHACGAEVHVWTVNELADMDRLAAIGVDGIVTDRADLALQHFGR
ncbi:glycerophosphodiester phosphodiesterase family protein [Microbacterium amylolyticum]|uniref:Glycerophosphoryl diester phosphodiesterase n=1 Tax=Microbacterium amylolyticum TaxID=936337 RepID=A0ABS4ZF08_9MICO|nr:glycerophosphodiester phosphodiesterase family protein [Microbacterium amylolyticum]MBP2435618.1 glycerophosphoryl diester phosphodiesterase [Microbacterium amylolyticum]